MMEHKPDKFTVLITSQFKGKPYTFYSSISCCQDEKHM